MDSKLNKGKIKMIKSIIYGESTQITGEILHNQKIVQPFVTISDKLKFVKISVATYMRKNYGGIEISIVGQDGNTLKSNTFDIAKFQDNSQVEFNCDTNLEENKKYDLVITGLGTSKNSSITMKCGQARNQNSNVTIFGESYSGELDCEFIYDEAVKEIEPETMKFNGKVSIVLPILDYDDNLKIKLDSISDQNYKNVEVLASMSKFAMAKEAKEFLKSYPLPISIYMKRDVATVDELKNHVLNRITGDYVLFYDEDVVFDRTYFSKMIYALEQGNKVAYSNFTNGSTCTDLGYFDHTKLYENKIPIIVPMIKLPVVDFDTTLGDLSTFDFYLTTYEQGGDFVFVDDILLKMVGELNYKESTTEEVVKIQINHPNTGLRKETSNVRRLMLKFIPPYGQCSGIDIGFGGDIIRDDFLGCDLKVPYGDGSNYTVDIPCDVTKGIPVDNEQFDVVYSSYLIEDFLDSVSILAEFSRILKPGGIMILVFPDQEKYVKYCRAHGEIPNQSHKHKVFNERTVDAALKEVGCVKAGSRSHWEVGEYSHILKFKKK